MGKFNLLDQLNSGQSVTPKPKITYQTYEIMVEGEILSVGIPMRVAKDFEDEMSYYDIDNMDSQMLRAIVRKFRGIKV